MTDDLPELAEIEKLCTAARHETIATVDLGGRRLPIHALSFGSEDPTAPVLIVVGGVHGLERIGSGVAIAYLQSLVAQRAWDATLQAGLARARIVVVPLLNPGGMALRRRANPAGVDLMRNAPPHPTTRATPLLGGQQLSRFLPYFGGARDAPMQPEAQALVDLVERETARAPFSVALDLHSGYGAVDRLWFPYARSKTPPVRHVAEIFAYRELLDRALPNHVYVVEPVAQSYRIAGDLWDHIYDRAVERRHTMLPLTLEMGSWAWVRKNPLQGLTSLGRFNPIKPHRLRRTLRRHIPLVDFTFRATVSHETWATLGPDDRLRLEQRALDAWY